MRILFLGDTVGNMGVKLLQEYLPKLKQNLKPQITIINGENATSYGRGINEKVYKQIMNAGADVITLGNHAWNNADIFNFIDQKNNLIRPANFPGKDVPGRGFTTINVNGIQVAIINLQGRVFMDTLDDPFQTIDKVIEHLPSKTKHIFIDFHAETTSEKKAMAMYLDGRISALVGTHTHVQTNDARILPHGTGYLTDAGMTGSYDGVIGMQYAGVIKHFLTQRPSCFEVEENGRGIVSGCFIDIDNVSGKTKKVQTVQLSPQNSYQF